MAGKLAPSLKNLFAEIDERWPRRDRRTDGWYADPDDRISKGHNPGRNGYSHAIDVDVDGINPAWIVANIEKVDGVLWYIIWNETLYSNTYDWKPRPYVGKSKHKDHMHIEIYQADKAERFTGWWGIDASRSTQPSPDSPPTTPGGGDVFAGEFDVNYGGRDYRLYLYGIGEQNRATGTALVGTAGAIRQLRG